MRRTAGKGNERIPDSAPDGKRLHRSARRPARPMGTLRAGLHPVPSVRQVPASTPAAPRSIADSGSAARHRLFPFPFPLHLYSHSQSDNRGPVRRSQSGGRWDKPPARPTVGACLVPARFRPGRPQSYSPGQAKRRPGNGHAPHPCLRARRARTRPRAKPRRGARQAQRRQLSGRTPENLTRQKKQAPYHHGAKMRRLEDRSLGSALRARQPRGCADAARPESGGPQTPRSHRLKIQDLTLDVGVVHTVHPPHRRRRAAGVPPAPFHLHSSLSLEVAKRRDRLKRELRAKTLRARRPEAVPPSGRSAPAPAAAGRAVDEVRTRGRIGSERGAT